ncbi:hypothetical protein P9597_11045 [Aneurinibacillus migulanus]|uniref:hypothetical protein n=1 Tax=Aneurinibacillus migulanus TaxID=47500 RepID=UPI002E217BE6|nr:hypothetical protein [Aneurinibacillus migulanus]
MFDTHENNYKPTVTDLSQLDVAVLLEKQILILGMLRNGTPEEKKRAREEAAYLQETVARHINGAARAEARRRLNLPAEQCPHSIPFLTKE